MKAGAPNCICSDDGQPEEEQSTPDVEIKLDVRYRLGHGYYVQWHCPLCSSTMSSGEWMSEIMPAMHACLDSMEHHALRCPKRGAL